MTAPGSSGLDPTATAAEELRWRLGALVSRHGERLATDPDVWRACELELSPFYAGPYAVRTYALVQALKHRLVADLVSWHAEGARGVGAELAQRLVERSGVASPIAEWAMAQWAFAFRLHDDRRAGAPAAARAATPAPAAVVANVADPSPAAHPSHGATTHAPAGTQPAAGGAMELVVGVPQLAAVGAIVALAIASLLGPRIAAIPRVASLLGEPAAEAPPLPPAPALEGLPSRGGAAAIGRDTVAVSTACARGGVDGSATRNAPPRLLRDVAPPFPREITDAAVGRGSVMLRYVVGADGRVDASAVEVLSATDEPFARSAIEALAALRYRPARRDGCATRATLTRTFRFRR